MLTVKKSLLFFIIAAVFVVSAAHLSFISAGENGEVDVTFGEFQGPEHEAVLSDPPKTKSIGQRFVNEELNYKIDFWVFSGVALGNVTMVQESEKIYVVTFKAKTTGAARWLRKRKDTYIERLEEVDGGRRFRTLSLEEHSEVGKKKKRKTLTTLDHVKKTMTVEKWKQGKLRKPKSFEIPEGKNYDGPFTAFYNFRYGMYGDIEHDKEYLVKTFPKKQDEEVEISIRLLGVTDSAKRVKKWRLSRSEAEGGYMADVNLDKELFDSKSGDIEIFFTSEMIPLRAIAKDVMLFGDIKAELLPAVETKD